MTRSRVSPGKTVVKRNAQQKKTYNSRAGSLAAKHFRQKGAPAKRAKAVLQHVAWKTLELENLNPLLQRQFVVGQNVMLARVLLKKGCVVPEHSHMNEQVTFILEGALKFWIDGKEIVVAAGEVLTIPPNMPHKAEAVEDTVDIDVFNPPRADWMNKDDQYLRMK